MAGTLRRNENRAAHDRCKPPPRPTAMVRPERDRPGKMASPCARPTSTLCLQVVSLSPTDPPGINLVAATIRPVMIRAIPDPQGAFKGLLRHVPQGQGYD